ncbi:MAG TPA: two-component sensor histidine kinase, partial [Cyanophyceae cyanobacterium]
MEQNPLFSRTRLHLAGWYAGVMGCILGLCGLGVYHVVALANRETIDRGLESVANALHDSIEPVLQRTGQLQQIARELSFELCLTQADCLPRTAHTLPPIPKVSESVSYYMRLVDKTGRPIALAGKQPERLPSTSVSKPWQTLADGEGMQYRQISLPLHNQNHLWGYLQMGRSLNDLNQHLAALRLTLLLGWPVAMLLIATSSWWLAGKAMQPVYQSYQHMQQFTADAAHEFRTP